MWKLLNMWLYSAVIYYSNQIFSMKNMPAPIWKYNQTNFEAAQCAKNETITAQKIQIQNTFVNISLTHKIETITVWKTNF